MPSSKTWVFVVYTASREINSNARSGFMLLWPTCETDDHLPDFFSASSKLSRWEHGLRWWLPFLSAIPVTKCVIMWVYCCCCCCVCVCGNTHKLLAVCVFWIIWFTTVCRHRCTVCTLGSAKHKSGPWTVLLHFITDWKAPVWRQTSDNNISFCMDVRFEKKKRKKKRCRSTDFSFALIEFMCITVHLISLCMPAHITHRFITHHRARTSPQSLPPPSCLESTCPITCHSDSSCLSMC